MNADPVSQDRQPPQVLRSAVRSLGLLGPYYRFVEWRGAMAYPKPPALANDGKPLPSRLAMMRIIGVSDWRTYYDQGLATARMLVETARAVGAEPSRWTAVLDWGCGCGRIARHMPALTQARIHGRDIDAYTVRWSARHLDGDFRVCGLKPPLDLPPASIDFAYGLSVLTHLSAPMQAVWFEELGRVLKPGALAALSYHDLDHPSAQGVAFRKTEDGVFLTEWAMEGSNLVAAFQDLASIERAAAPWFDLVRHVPREDTGFDQALAVLRRKQT